MNNLPDGFFIVGNKLMAKCEACGKIVRVDKLIFGSLHCCVLAEEEKILLEKRRYANES